MSTTTLQFELRQGGALTDPDANSVLLRDLTGTYGVRRTDTLATVVAAGTAMVRQSAGVYAYPVTDPAAGLTYQWVAEYAVGGVTKHDTFTAYAYGAGLTGFWSSQSAVEQEFGVDACKQDVDLNNNGAGTAVVWQQALNWVDALVDRIFGQAGYARPTNLTLTDYVLASGYAGSLVRNEIHGGRGSQETNGAGGPATGGVFQADADKAERALRLMAVRGVAFPKVLAEANVAPSSIAPTRDRYGFPVGTSASPRPFGWPVLPWGGGWGYGGW